MIAQDVAVATVVRSEQGGQTAERILEAATKLFASHGYAATGVAALGREAGVQPASIYWAFGSKEGVLAAAVQHAAQAWLAEHGPRIDDAAKLDPYSAVEVIGQEFAEDPAFLRLLLLLALERRDGNPAIIASAREVRAVVRERFAEAFATHPPVAGTASAEQLGTSLAELLLVLLDGAFISRQVEGDAHDLRHTFSLLAMALRGAAVQLVDDADT